MGDMLMGDTSPVKKTADVQIKRFGQKSAHRARTQRYNRRRHAQLSSLCSELGTTLLQWRIIQQLISKLWHGELRKMGDTHYADTVSQRVQQIQKNANKIALMVAKPRAWISY